MGSHTSDTDAVRHIRTFADDVRRAHGENSPGGEGDVPQLTPIPQKGGHTEETKRSPKKEARHQPQPQPPEAAPKEPPTSLQRAFNTMQSSPQEGDDIETASGTIVRDNIRKRWSLSQSLKDAFTSWFKDKRTAFEEMTGSGEEARPDVAPAATRADIIKKAGTYGTIAPQDDHDSVLSGLRAQTTKKGAAKAKEKATEQFENKEKGEAQDTRSEKAGSNVGWTHTVQEETEPESRTSTPRSIKKARPLVMPEGQTNAGGSSVHREHIISDGANAIAPVQKERADDEAYIKRQKEVKEEHAQTTGLRDTADVAPSVEQSEGEAAETAQARTLHSDIQRTQEKEDTQTESVDRYREDPTKEEEISPIPLKKSQHVSADPSRKTSTVRTFRDDAIRDVESKKLSRSKIAAAEAAQRDQRRKTETQKPSGGGLSVVLVASLVVALLIGGSTAYLWMQSDTRAEPVVVTRVPSFVGSIEQIPIGFSEDRAELMGTLTDAVMSLDRDSNTLTQLYPSRSSDAGEQVIDTATFMNVFDPQTSGSFVRSLRSDMMFGAYSGENTDPFFVFKTEQFDTALAGMLAWEGAMSADLSPLFGPPVRRTFDPTSFTADNAREAAFTDDVIRNTNVRVLYDELGEVRILYAFVDKETLVITSNIEAMVALFERLR